MRLGETGIRGAVSDTAFFGAHLGFPKGTLMDCSRAAFYGQEACLSAELRIGETAVVKGQSCEWGLPPRPSS
jgi:hypothetical protein